MQSEINTCRLSHSIKMDISKMKNGDVAGLAVFQDPYAYIGVKQIQRNPLYRHGE